MKVLSNKNTLTFPHKIILEQNNAKKISIQQTKNLEEEKIILQSQIAVQTEHVEIADEISQKNKKLFNSDSV